MICILLQYSLSSLERALLTFLSGGSHEQPFDASCVPMAPPPPAAAAATRAAAAAAGIAAAITPPADPTAATVPHRQEHERNVSTHDK